MICAGRRVGVDVQRADDGVAALQGDTQCFANTALHDRVGRIEAGVVAGIVGADAFLAIDHVIENGAADGDRALLRRSTTTTVLVVTIAPRRRFQWSRVAVAEHDATPVRRHPVEYQSQHAIEQFGDAVGSADRQRRQVHHFEIAVGLGTAASIAAKSDRSGNGGDDT